MSSPVPSSSESDGTHAATAPSTGARTKTSNWRAAWSRRKGVAILRKFFEDNPDESLSVADAACKLGTDEHTASNYLGHLAGLGVLKRISIYELNQPEGT